MHSCMMARKPSLNMEHGFLKAIRRQLLQDAEGHGLQPADVSSRCDTHAASQTSVQVAAVPVHREPAVTKNQDLSQLLEIAKLSGFCAKARKFIQQTIEDPLEQSEYIVTEVCRCLTGRAATQSDYTHSAAVVIHYIIQVLVEDNQSVEPVETTVGNECHRLLPSACGQRWWDLRLTVHNCTWFLCDLLNQLKATQLPTATLVITLNEVFLQLVEVACKWTDDMAVLKEVLSKYGKDLDVWLTVDERNMLLSVLRDSFLDCDEYELKKEILSMIELLAGSFQLRDDAG